MNIFEKRIRGIPRDVGAMQNGDHFVKADPRELDIAVARAVHVDRVDRHPQGHVLHNEGNGVSGKKGAVAAVVEQLKKGW